MPSFYARPPPGLPITPPESMYYHQYAMYGMHDQKAGFDGYGQMQQYHLGYRQQALQFPPGLTHPAGCNTLPPLNGIKNDENMQMNWNQRTDANKSAPAKSEEKPTGGVAQVLDYEIEDMAEFVTSMAIGIILPGAQSQQTISAFKKFVFTILQSTRLPSSTVILSLDYLSHRMNNCPPTSQHKGLAHLYRMCTISLLLASKFLDDNTFQNRSWADVTGLQVSELNQLEADWLAAIGWQLHVARPGYTGFDSWKASWDSFISQRQVQHAPVLSPINTNINNRRHTMSFTHQAFSPQQQHPQSALPHGYIGDHLRQNQMNDGGYWCPELTSSAQPSPPSLASSGPTTPAWEFPINNWSHHFGSKPQFPSRVSPQRISPPLMQGFKNGSCNCLNCFHSRIPQLPTPPSMFPNFVVGYGQQIVA